MLGINTTTGLIRKSIYRIRVTRRLRMSIGALVLLTGGDHVGERAFVQNISVSPYWNEEREGIRRVYVYAENWDNGDHWTDWVLLSEAEVVG